MRATDWRGLCEELLGALETEAYAHWVEAVDSDPLINRARTALAQPEPEGVGPSVEELDELFNEIDQSGEPLSWRAYARAVLARWGRAALSQPEGEGVGPTDEELESDFRAWWKERYGESYFGAAPLVSVIDWAKRAIARFGGRPAPAPAGADGELVAWLAGLAVRAADCRQPKAAGMLTWAAQVVGEHADRLERQPAPVPQLPEDAQVIEPTKHTILVPAPVLVAIPGEEYHDDMGPVTWWRFPVDEPPWVGTPGDSDWPGYHTHFTPAPPEPRSAHALPSGEVEA